MLTAVTLPRRCTARDGLGASAHLRQGRELFVPDLFIGQSTVVLVQAGRKIVFGAGEQWVAEAGELILLPHGASYGVTNQLSGAAPYEAISLMFDDSLLAAAPAGPVPAFAPLSRPHVLRSPSASFRQTVERVRALWMDPATPATIARHAALEVLAWLAVHGCRFAPSAQRSIPERLRALLVSAPAEPWNAAQAAAALNLSEATLRRRLAREGTSMSRLLLEVRLCNAMMLLQASDDYVGQIALDSGFANHAHFSRLFKVRFGITPSQLRDPEAAAA
jgi:AraC-like DNA-binding protein